MGRLMERTVKLTLAQWSFIEPLLKEAGLLNTRPNIRGVLKLSEDDMRDLERRIGHASIPKTTRAYITREAAWNKVSDSLKGGR